MHTQEIRQHVLKVLKKSIFPPRTMTFALSSSDNDDTEGAESTDKTPSPVRNAQHARPAKRGGGGVGGGKPGERAVAGERPRSYQLFGEGARKEGELAMAAAEKAMGPAGSGAAGSAHVPEVRLYSSSEAEDESDDGVETVLPAGEVREESLGLTVARVKGNGPLLLAQVDPGRPAAKAYLLEGDELVEIGMQTVTHKDLALIARLLAWPAGDERKIRLVQLSIHRGRSLQHVNVEQKAPKPDAASAAVALPSAAPPQKGAAARGAKGKTQERANDKDGKRVGVGEGKAVDDGFGSMTNISAPSNVQKRVSVSRDPVSGELVGVPKDWQKVSAPLELCGCVAVGWV